MGAKESFARVAALDTLERAVKARLVLAREEALRDLLALRDAAGVKSASVVLPQGESVGTVTLPDAKLEPVVSDMDAFTAYVKASWPSEIEVVPEQIIPAHEQVRYEFIAELLNMLKADGEGGAFEPDSGEVVGGVTFPTVQPEPTSFRLVMKDREGLIRAWARGDLAQIVGADAPMLAEGAK